MILFTKERENCFAFTTYMLHLCLQVADDMASVIRPLFKFFDFCMVSFEKFKDCASELGDKNEMMSFVLGFKLGMRLAVEAMISMDDITDPKMT